MNKDENKPNALKLTTIKSEEKPDLPLPGILRTTTRAGVSEVDPLLAELAVQKVYTLSTTARAGVATEAKEIPSGQAELLAIEAEDGTTLFIRSDALAESVARTHPEAVIDGDVDFSRFRDPNAAARGIGDILWKTATVLDLPKDELVEKAKELALDWAREKFGEKLEDKAYEMGSFLGAKALIWLIESRLAGRSGLYHWQDKTITPDDRCNRIGDPRLKDASEGRSMLVLIHGTASYTLGSFADLHEDKDTWDTLVQHFPGGIFGYEHRTFSQSPIENALELAEALPPRAKVSLLTHSRGGLVGDLLCLGQVDDKAIDGYVIDSSDSEDESGLQREVQEERQRLRTLIETLRDKEIRIERYVRVACPARGTRFLSENLDAALSDLLNLMQVGGGVLVKVVAGAVGGPVAGVSFGKGASSALGVLKRLVLEIAGRRIDPRMIPGIAAMRIDSPLAAFLAHPQTRRHDGIAMAVIAGDTEFEGFGLSNLRRRIANLFCDWRLFDQQDNDLVVDTDSMYAGLGLRSGASYLYDQDASVSHFRYFVNPSTRDALRDWLAEDAGRLSRFQPLTANAKIPWRDHETRWAQRAAAPGTRPVVILIPGIMGSHIEVDRRRPDKAGSGDRIWFDPLSLGIGKLDRIADVDSAEIQAEDIFEMFYGDLADYLAHEYTVLRSPYDWRKSLDLCAGELLTTITRAVEQNPAQTIHLLAHSMGGLVVRALMKLHPAAWRQVIESGGRLVMLGTPNNGSHLMAHGLLGKHDSLRLLAKVDLTRGLQDVLEIVSGFPGALALLPRPGFKDAGSQTGSIATDDYYTSELWPELKKGNRDWWFGDGLGGEPEQAVLNIAKKSWTDILSDNNILNPERVSYVFGQSDKTPCGVVHKAGDKPRLLFTSDGDGSVTWESGRLENLPEDARCWYMPVEHADLTGVEGYFPAIGELIATGTTSRLNRLPRRRGEAIRTYILDAAPPVIPTEEELARALMGSGPSIRHPSRPQQALGVSVYAGNLRFVDQPVLCGHYIGDAISGAEEVLDTMLDGRLSVRERLGLYATEIGTSVIELRPPTEQESLRGSAPGAVIVGLGNYDGSLGVSQITKTVRAAVLHYLLQVRDSRGLETDAPVQLYSLLVGWNSSAHLSIAESVTAVTLGVLEANRDIIEAFRSSQGPNVCVSRLCFVELFLDAAITAMHAVQELPQQLEQQIKRLSVRIEPARMLEKGDGVLPRLTVDSELGHWSRLIVTNADGPEEAQKAVQEQRPYYPQRLKYLFLSQRARAESVEQQRQPGLIETIISEQMSKTNYDANLGHILFQLMLPLTFKAAAREQSRLLLVVDAYTAKLPWELLQADVNVQPLVLKMPMVRQLSSTRYRTGVRIANTNTACIIVAPDTKGFQQRFESEQDELAELPGAVREGGAIRESLQTAGWNTGDIVFSPPGKNALETFTALYARPYRLLTISAHGVTEQTGKDGKAYTGVVLSNGLLITATEIGAMEVVPEVVFLNCCHLGSINSRPNSLAYSLARELIEMGVRCIVAAGWAVNDDAAATFATTFFEQLVKGVSFGEAVFRARRAAATHQGSNTWGAYQAYGDPGYKLVTNDQPDSRRTDGAYLALDELLTKLETRRVDSKRPRQGKKQPDFTEQVQWVGQQLAKCPVGWDQQPEVMQAIAALYGEYGDVGFEAARDNYERALQLEDKQGKVSVKSIEQLANLEARQGAKLGKNQVEKGVQLIDRAITRLDALKKATQDQHALINAERAGLLGSALKRKAVILVTREAAGWGEISTLLKMAAEAYREGVGADPASSPYNTLNALSLAWLAGTLKENENAQLALQCGEQARQKFATSRDFWDAVMCGDAELTAWLMGEKNPSITAAVHLHQVYEQAVAKLPQSAREWDSVVDQWRLLVRFLKLRNAKDDKIRIEVLEQLIGERVANPAESESVVSESSQARPAQKKKAAVSKSKAKRQPRNRPRDS